MSTVKTTFSEREAERKRIRQLRDAAPDLLKACETVVANLKPSPLLELQIVHLTSEEVEAIRAAIKKARP